MPVSFIVFMASQAHINEANANVPCSFATVKRDFVTKCFRGGYASSICRFACKFVKIFDVQRIDFHVKFVDRIFDIATMLDKAGDAAQRARGHQFHGLGVQNATRPHEFSIEFSGPLDDLAELYGEDVLPKGGAIELTDKPGFSIELNEAAVARLKA